MRLAVLSAVVLLTACGSANRGPTTFDAARWQADTPCGTKLGQRARMVDDLLKHHLRVGETTERLFSVLGQADFDITSESQGSEDLTYGLGMRGPNCAPALDVRIKRGKVIAISRDPG